MKKWLRYLGFFLFCALIVLVTLIYVILLMAGKGNYEMRARQVNGMVAQYPAFFETTFNEIFSEALKCQNTKEVCVQSTRTKFDQLSTKQQVKTNLIVEKKSTDNFFVPVPSNQQPIYFITLLPDKKIAKLFFSGDVRFEQIDTRVERMVVEVLEGKRKELYGPYFGEEVFAVVRGTERTFYDPKPAYLKDLYSQMEVIVPYYQDDKLVGAIVYLHGS